MVLLPTDLVGTWTLRRTVVDHRAGVSGEVTGTTTLRSSASASASASDRDDEVVWTEEGTMTLGGRSTPVSRKLLVRRAPDGQWRVHFADGRLFHDWTWGATVEHACAPDDYTGLLDGDADRWTVRWQARGPAKDYRLDSVLERRTDAAD